VHYKSAHNPVSGEFKRHWSEISDIRAICGEKGKGKFLRTAAGFIFICRRHGRVVPVILPK